MKKSIIFTLVLSAMCQAQVSLNPTINNNLLYDMKQGITTGDKSFVLPKNVITDRKVKTNVDLPADSKLESGLLVFNTTKSTTFDNIDKGIYFWYNLNNTSGAWTPMVSDNNKGVLTNLNFIKNYQVDQKVDTYSTISNPASNSWINNLGDDINSKRWQVVDSFSSTFDIYSAKNIITLQLSSFVEAYNKTNVANQYFSYEVGIFIDDKLAVYRPFVVTFNQGRRCVYNSYSMMGLLKDLPIGKYSLKVAVKNRNILNNDGGANSVEVSYNKRSTTTCSANSYLTDNGTSGLLTIQIQENPSILNN